MIDGLPSQPEALRVHRFVSNVPKEAERRYRQNRAQLRLEAQPARPALRAGRLDRCGRPEDDNDNVERYSNSKESDLLRAP